MQDGGERSELTKDRSTKPHASWYQFSPDRLPPKDHLSTYQGWMHADGYAGFEDLYRSSDIREVACMAQVRRHPPRPRFRNRQRSHLAHCSAPHVYKGGAGITTRTPCPTSAC
ncbi:IS66 family transposase [Pelagimonas varians]|uniref:IS66 family transposase n=1 Tax=Pelagimonas varians TaxID=696760 RepID=UPI001473FE1E